MGAVWFTTCGPQQILSVFYKNVLGATAGELGEMVSLIQLSSVFNLAAIFIYSRTRTRKTFWTVSHVLHRLFGFVLAGVSVYVAQAEDAAGAKDLGTRIIMGAMVVSWVLTTSAASGWWSWMADLVPEGIRGTFFGRRASIVRAVNILWFFGASFALDHLGFLNLFYVYAAVFTVASVLGILDIAIHAFIPEPDRGPDVPRVGWSEFTEPLQNRNFLFFSLSIGAWSFSTSVLSPFIAPYITADVAADGIGAPLTWLSINAAVTQLTMIATGTAWGVIMDRFGRKPAVLLGALHPMPMWAAVFFMTPANYPYLLVTSALLAGLLAAGFWDGSGQLMLTLTPQRNRNAYLSWHMAVVGIIAAGGSWVGGQMGDALAGWRHELWSGFAIGGFHVVAIVSFVLSAGSTLMLAYIREGSEKPVGFVVARIFTPGVFRTFLNLNTITSSVSSSRTARALRTIDGASSHLAVTDILNRLDDPDPEVRAEAARALGRTGSAEGVTALLERLRDPHSTIRTEAAWALGEIGDPRAVPALVDVLSSGSEELQEAAAKALGAIGNQAARLRLHGLIHEPRTDRVFTSVAEAISKLGVLEAVWEIVPRMHATVNPVLRRQLAIATGNCLGSPGEFYTLLTGETAHQGARLGVLFRGARRAVLSFRPAALEDAERAALREIEDDLPRLRGLMEGQSYRPAVEAMHAHMRTLVRMAISRPCDDPLALEYALARDAKLGVGFWFIGEARRQMNRVTDPELMHIDSLLALYFLSVYRLPPEPPTESA
jgi:hypothetical protein